MINMLFSYVDALVVSSVVLVCLLLATYLFLAYYKSPCGMCSEAKRCTNKKKIKPNWVKKYNQCYNRKSIENIFLDFNGTILDDLDLCYELLCEMTTKFGVKHISLYKYRDLFDFPVKKYYETAGFDFSKVDYNEVGNYFMSNYMKRWPNETKIFKDFVSVIKKIRNQNIKVYIITATEENLLKEQLKHFGIEDLFDGFVASKDLKAKGKIEYAKEFILEKKINPRKSIMVGDTIHDFAVSQAIGMRCLLLSKGHNTKRKLKATGSPVINSYKQFYKYIQNNR